MDTTEKYVKMCEKAEEIQKLSFIGHGDWYAYLRHKEGKDWPPVEHSPIVELITVNRDDGKSSHVFNDSIEHCWLPRQDQLQEILWISGKQNNPYHLAYEVSKFGIESKANEIKGHGYADAKSMEQLWLAFIMKEKYQKIWNGEDWIK